MTRTFLMAAVATLIAPVTLAAQDASPIVGRWTIEWESGRRVMNDEVTVIRSTGELTVKVQGDSLVADLTTTKRSDGMAPPKPSAMFGRKTATGAAFTQANEVVMNMNGEERRQTIVSTWTLSADGDQLKGTIARAMPGMAMAPEPTIVTGTRIK